MKNLGRLMLLMLLLVVGSASVEAQNWAGSVGEERVELRGRDRELRDVKAMRGADFKKFYKYVKEISFDKNKLQLIEIASFGSYFSSEQCYKLLSLFSFDDNKLAAIKIMEPRMIDSRYYEKILKQFSFSSNREKAAAILLRGVRR